MAGELEADFTTGITGYFQIRTSTGTIWRVDSLVFEAYSTANIAHYNIAAAEQGSASGYYTATFPTQITAGIYNVVFKKQAGGSPAESDLTVGTGSVDWSGTAVSALSNLISGFFATIGEGTLTFIQMMRLILASAVTKTNGAVSGSSGTFNIRDVADSKNRVVATYDANGNRTAVTLDGT